MNPDRYAVLGNPIAHSWSPRIHAAFAAQTGESISYVAQQVDSEQFEAVVADFFATQGRGLNITLPYKQRAYALASQAAPAAQQAGAANTLYLDANQQLCCDNTDGRGLVRDLVDNHGVSLRDQSVLLLGAGGAARSVLGALLSEQPARLHIANRTAQRALELRRLFPGADVLSAGGLVQLDAEEPFAIIINATSAGLTSSLPDLSNSLLAPQGVCYDMVYGAEATAFQRWGAGAGAILAADGLGMLVEQAAEAFRIWRGVRPQTRPVIESLRRSL